MEIMKSCGARPRRRDAGRSPFGFALWGAVALAAFAGCAPDDGSRDLAAAQKAAQVHDLARADRHYAAALKCAPANVDALVGAAETKLALGEIPAARAHVDAAKEIAGGEPDVRLLDAQLAYHENKSGDAAKAAYAAIANDAALDAGVRAQAWAGLGVVLLMRDEFDGARAALLTALRLDRRNAAARYHLGYLYRNLGYREAALEQFEVFVRLDKTASPRVQRVQRRDIPALREEIAQQLRERPGADRRDSTACAAAISAAEAAVKKSDYKTARGKYQAALAADPLSYPAALGLAEATLRGDMSSAGQKKAYECYRMACGLRADAIPTFLAAGALAAKLGQHQSAAEIYSRAMAADPANVTAVDGLIRALRRVDRRQAAARYQAYRDVLVPAKR